jgi:nucleoside-diphosphate-sugar epimerase
MLAFSKALVTGGAGFIGSHIVDQLIQQGCEVTVLDDLSSGSLSNLKNSTLSRNFSFVKGTIHDNQTVKKALKDVEVVFHEAAVTSVPRSLREPKLTNYVNVEGTLNVLLNANNSRSVNRFIFASSAAVYGNCQELPIKTTSALMPISPYGASKVVGEQLCLESHRLNGLGTTILRYFNAYGPRSSNDEYTSVINKFMQRLIQLKSPIIFGDGESTRDFIYVKDIAVANILAASTNKSIGKIYNIATGKPTTMNRVASLELELLFGPNVVIPFEYVPRINGDIINSYAEVASARDELGFRPRFSLEQGLRHYFLSLYPSVPLAYQNVAICS